MSAYSKTPWENNNFPEISADKLGRIETASQNALGVDTIAALRALGTPAIAYRCWVRGSSAINDGYGGAFDWNSTSSASDDGEVTILPTGHSGNGRWILNAIDTDWQTVSSFDNSWLAFNATSYPVGYKRHGDGLVSLRGVIKSGTIGSNAFTLASGYRPTHQIFLPAIANSATLVELLLNTNGNVAVNVTTNDSNAQTWTSLSGCRFSTR